MIYKCTYPGCTYTENSNDTTPPRHKHGLGLVEMRVPVEIGSMGIDEKDFNKQKRGSGAASD